MGRQRPGTPTLEEVAALAGVGRGTVSRVINNATGVRDSTRRAVQQAIAELGTCRTSLPVPWRGTVPTPWRW
ncbi:hypothetical protein STENM327S_07664 [Streptomyces tendae]